MQIRIQPALATAVALGFSAFGAHAGTIVGKVEAGSTALGDSVVSVEGIHGGSAPSQRVTMNQVNKTFVPHVVAIQKGGSVEFLNSDDFLHNTYSQSKTKSFDLHQPGKNSRSLLRTEEPGVIDVRCHIHGSMQAWIVVLDNPYFATTDSRGLFRINGVPPGTYRVKSWNEAHGTLTQEVHVTAAGGKAIFKYAK